MRGLPCQKSASLCLPSSDGGHGGPIARGIGGMNKFALSVEPSEWRKAEGGSIRKGLGLNGMQAGGGAPQRLKKLKSRGVQVLPVLKKAL